jgi:TetR/AcrR family transcriptional regulator, transcriptional repressor of aconitase
MSRRTFVSLMMEDMPKVSQQHRDARRDQILSAARRCFMRDGFHTTSMQDLFSEAGLSSGAVYSYFASKDDVILAIAEENMRGVIETIRTVINQRPDAPAGAVIAEALDMLHAEDARNGIAKLAVIVWGEALRNPSLAAGFAAMVTRIRADLTEYVRDRQRSGDLPWEPPADAVAATFMSFVPGYILQLALLGSAAVDGIPDALRALWPSSASARIS